MPTSVTNFSQLLQEADSGNVEAANHLFVLVEDQLRFIARKRRARLRLRQGVDTSITGLIDQAFCEIVGQGVTTWQSDARQKFFRYITVKMNDLLIEAMRAQAAQKRGGGLSRVDNLELLPLVQASQWENVDLLLDLNEALHRLEQLAADDALIFRLRYLLGCTFDEVASTMSISASSAMRAFDRARSWLQRELEDYA